MGVVGIKCTLVLVNKLGSREKEGRDRKGRDRKGRGVWVVWVGHWTGKIYFAATSHDLISTSERGPPSNTEHVRIPPTHA